HRGRAEVRPGDHRDATDGVEQAPEEQRAEEGAGGEHHEQVRHVARADADEERESEDRAGRVAAYDRPRELAERDRAALADGDRVARRRELRAGLATHILLDPGDDPLGLLLVAVEEQPARALRDVAADDEDAETEDRTRAERQAPADVAREDRRVQ